VWVTRADLRALEQRLDQRLSQIDAKLGEIVAAQDDINAAVAQVQATMTDVGNQVTQLGTDVTGIQAEITALQQQNPTVDTTALNAAVASLATTQQNLDAAVSSVAAIVPPPAP
jgi:predicted  nucleic acid-binding Zn-ribbon protein